MKKPRPIALTRPGKQPLIVHSPVMPAAGTFGFGDSYKMFVDLDKLGAIITNPVTHQPWSPARGTRVVPLPAGMLLHTGLPNPGVKKLIQKHAETWAALPVPVIVHLVATSTEDIKRAIPYLEAEDTIAAVELGLNDDITYREAAELVRAAADTMEKPLLVRLPAMDAYSVAGACADAGAGALVVAAPPRGTAHDPRTGTLVSGRVYGPLVKPLILRMVGVLAKRLTDIPIIGAGGIHSGIDARDYLEAGAVAVQVDSVTWVKPRLLERIARDLSKGIKTRATGSFADEWHPDMGDTEYELLKLEEELKEEQDKSAKDKK